MNKHRLHLLANLGHVMCAEEPESPENGGGGETPTPAENDGQESQEAPKETHPWDSPEIAEAEIKRLRNQAASYRTQKRELEQQLQGAKSQEDVDAVIAEWSAKTAKLERENLILAHASALPETLRKYVQGETEDEIKASVEELKATVSTPAPPHRVGGGLNPGKDAPETDPAKLAAKVRASRGAFRF